MQENICKVKKSSIIEDVQQLLGVENRSELRYPPHVLDFLELILRCDMIEAYPKKQYWYVANFIVGQRTCLDRNEAITYLEKLKASYEKHYLNAGRTRQKAEMQSKSEV